MCTPSPGITTGMTGSRRSCASSARVDGWADGWTRQSRSYFALRLPHRWWLWAIDISFDRFIDRPQLAYFQELGRTQVQPGDRLILCTAKPSWVHQGMTGDEVAQGQVRGRTKPPALRTGRDRADRAHLVLTLSGDLHHYARYATEDGAKAKITAGLAGAYLYPPTGCRPPSPGLPAEARNGMRCRHRSRPWTDRGGLRGGVLKARSATRDSAPPSPCWTCCSSGWCSSPCGSRGRRWPRPSTRPGSPSWYPP